MPPNSDKHDDGKKKKIKIRDLKPRKDPKGGYDDPMGESPPPEEGSGEDPYSYP